MTITRTDSGGPINLHRLREMEADFGADELALIVAAFLTEAAAALGALRAGWSDDACRRDRLHFLKGCARTIGAVRLGELCAWFEEAGMNAEAVQTLEREFSAVGAALALDRSRTAG